MAILSRKTLFESQISKDSSMSETMPILRKTSPEAHSLCVTFQCLYAVKHGHKTLIIMPVDKNIKAGDYMGLCPPENSKLDKTEKFRLYPQYSKAIGVKVKRVVTYQDFETFFTYESFSQVFPWVESKEEFLNYMVTHHPLKISSGPFKVVQISL